MTFKTFWPMYLRGHSLPGTRALHYFATVVGILGAVEAIVVRQPLVFVAGIVLGYMIAVSSHWLVERNQPLISVSMFWIAVADLRMCWFAVRGRLPEELRRNVSDSMGAQPHSDIKKGAEKSERAALRGSYLRYALLAVSAVGLIAGMLDLEDIFEAQEGLHYPIVQLGAPIVAFVAAFGVGARAILLAWAASLQIREAEFKSHAMPRQSWAGAVMGLPTSVAEESLWRAYLALLAFGVGAFALAELAEHGVPHAEEFYLVIALPLGLICISVFLVRQLAYAAGAIEEGTIFASDGPQTLGVRVDGRVKLVDFLENCLSFGRRREILAATLETADVAPGQRILDIGCGTGELAVVAAAIVASSSTSLRGYAMGIDATPGMIDLARQRAKREGVHVRFEVAAAEILPLEDGELDAVTSSFFFHHLPSALKQQALQEMWRVLAPGGRLVITDYGSPQSILGLIASFPMRFNFHEHVRGQLRGELEHIIALEAIGTPTVRKSFLGYINVLVLNKPT